MSAPLTQGSRRIATARQRLAPASEGTALTASYTYTNDNLTGITTGTTTYTLSYGSFSLMSSIKVGSRTLASYSYTDDRNNNLASLDYGNGDSVDYTYDGYGRVVAEAFVDENGVTQETVTYKYDNSGALATVTDSKSGRSVTYYYDFTDRLMKVVESGSGYSHSVGYEYDDINNLTKLVETINGAEYSTSYAYDDDNRLTSITNGSASEHYVYDAYSRVTTKTTKNGSTTVLTDSVTYKNPTSTTTTAQVATQRSLASGYDVTYTYTYDDNGNILSISDGTNTTSYVYDTSNQLVRENNQAAGKTWTWTYDNGGNITSRKEYAYTTGTLSTSTDTVSYTYDATWGDLLTGYDGNTITSDEIGNMRSDGTWTYTWQNGRELASMTDGSTTWNYTYDADGMRISRSNGTDTYSYVYNGGKLTQMTKGSDVLTFAYDETAPMTVTWNGNTYYYVTNIQGDVVAILDANGNAVVRYTYDAWGNILSTTGDMADTLGALNPLRYRGYVYDTETGLYYLQSRYYDAELGRFICADAFVSTGQGILGNNMFAYCHNNPIEYVDDSGRMIMDAECDTGGGFQDWSKYEEEPELTLVRTNGTYFSLNTGIFELSGTVEFAFDLRGNIQIVGSASFDASSAGKLSASGGITGSAYIMPDTSYLAGGSYYGGGGYYYPVNGFLTAGTSLNVVQTADGYWGVTNSIGYATIGAQGSDVHGGYAETISFTKKFNIFNWVSNLFGGK